jgi:hypothetical protein
MQKNPLIKTNPYLKDALRREALLTTSVISSTAIEGVRLADINQRTSAKKPKKITQVHESRASYGSRR